MAFLKRLGWYLMGLSIGIVFLVFFLKKKSGENRIDFCYLPNCRVLKDIRSKTFVFNGKENISFTQLDSLTQLVLLDGDVDFKKSDTEAAPCKIYFIEAPDNTEAFNLKVKNCADVAHIEKVANSDL